MAALQTLLSAQVLTNVISQVAGTSDWLQMLCGVQAGGKNIINHGHGRIGSYHIYNSVRKIGRGRAPGAAAGRRALNPMGEVHFTYPRMHEYVSLLAETIHNLGLISDPAVRDKAGADMVRRQTDTLGQLAGNWRKAMLVGALRDSLYVGFEGDDMFYDFTSTAGVKPVIQQHGRMPAGNKLRLNMLGTGNIIDTSWAVETADIPGHLGQINAAFQQLCGGHLSAIVCGTKLWNYVIKNEHVRQSHGSSNAPFVSLTRDALEPEIAKSMKNVYRAVLNIYPDVTWYVTDEGLEVGKPGEETFQKLVPDGSALMFGHEPDDGTLACYEGSEPIAEYDGGPETLRIGQSSWSVKRANPTSTDIFTLDNALICNQVPASEAFATPVF